MITKELIIESYIFLRENNNSIPSETLDFIKDAAIEKLNSINTQKDNDLQECLSCVKTWMEDLPSNREITISRSYDGGYKLGRNLIKKM